MPNYRLTGFKSLGGFSPITTTRDPVACTAVEEACLTQHLIVICMWWFNYTLHGSETISLPSDAVYLNCVASACCTRYSTKYLKVA